MEIHFDNDGQTLLPHYKQVSFETLAASWFTFDGWEVFAPIIDHDMKTDLLVSDGNNFYRIQVKTIESHDESHVVENKWGKANCLEKYGLRDLFL